MPETEAGANGVNSIAAPSPASPGTGREATESAVTQPLIRTSELEEIARLRSQIATLEKERDEWQGIAIKRGEFAEAAERELRERGGKG